ncbi:hypothetical protein EC912_11015 [Luteibacter rhizovicinus]|uniref:Uncharacterized protein n=1 Tax=Luteibacter rhizovicinus TaxID=242606 RepID=A0A4R3YG71_9GAMM|nr:DUF493 family protein [Luteibacter rhizovicinus]TCV91585.1 hypothetical protein EC912_11015 [Luteibacter rhizovicinus]
MQHIDLHAIKRPDQGFQFPGEFEITAIGFADKGLDARVPEILAGIGLKVLHETLSTKKTPAGNYQSVSVTFVALTREKYDEAHAALKADENIRFTL